MVDVVERLIQFFKFGVCFCNFRLSLLYLYKTKSASKIMKKCINYNNGAVYSGYVLFGTLCRDILGV